jgi:hypothetical protein
VAVTLGVPLRDLTDIDNQYTVPEDAEAIFALVSRRRPETARKAYNVLRAMFSEAERTLTPR